MRALDSVRYQRYHFCIGPEDFLINVPEGKPFHLPVPGPHDRVMFIRGEPEGEGAAKEHEDIMLRRVPRETAMRFRAAAGGRSLTHGQYLAALVELHRVARERADGGDEDLRRLLEALGLASVTV